MSARWIIPEVMQSSACDCGPATVKALLGGLGVDADYERLRRACRTEVDGTSIDQIEDLLRELGLDAEQTVVPADLLVASGSCALPAIVVTRAHDGLAHFVVGWRRHGRVVQVMDPGRGRRWLGVAAFEEELFVHTVAISQRALRGWSRAECLCAPLTARLAALGVARSVARRLVDGARQRTEPAAVVALDAVVRMLASLRAESRLPRGFRIIDGVRRLWPAAIAEFGTEGGLVPRCHWSAWPRSDGAVLVTGAVVVRVPAVARVGQPRTPAAAVATRRPDLVSQTPAVSVERRLWRAILREGRGQVALWIALLALTGIAITGETFVLARLVDMVDELGASRHRAVALVAVASLSAALLATQVPLRAAVIRLGRRLEGRLRIELLERLGQAPDRFFATRQSSDLGDRMHSLHMLRELPELFGTVVQRVATLLATTAALLWVAPGAAAGIVALAAAAVVLPALAQRVLRERDLRMRTLHAGLASKYFDALLGAEPLRTHDAGTAVRNEHEAALVAWRQAGQGLLRASVLLEAVLGAVVTAIAASIVVRWLLQPRELGDTLLVMYWTVSLPWLARDLLAAAQRYPGYRTTAARVLDPGAAPEPEVAAASSSTPPERRSATRPYGCASGVSLQVERLSVRAGARSILDGVSLEIRAGEHVAIVGRSGAGKSTLLGVLLGFTEVSGGCVRVDDQPLDEAACRRLRRDVAWVDPSIGVWNTTVLDNLTYGVDEPTPRRVADALEGAALRDVIGRLPYGLQTPVGAGGTVLSGGEGQRVRFARAMMRSDARLVLLDEPFRGLELAVQRSLLERARARWRRSTMLYVTHDLESALRLDRVLVIEGGRVVEDGHPRTLAADPTSRFCELLAVDRTLRESAWREHAWRRIAIADAHLVEQERSA